MVLLRNRTTLLVFLLLAAAVGCGGGSSSLSQKGLMPSILLAAKPASITAGSSTTLTWTSTNSTSVSIPGLGTFPANGSVQVSPSTTTTYTATATGSGGSASASTAVNVSSSGAAPTVSLTAQPSTIGIGDTTVLTWTSTNATSVDLGALGTFGPNGSTNDTPSATTTYTATATGPGGKATSSTTVTIAPRGHVPHFGHVFLLVEENHSYSSVIGNSTMPYLNGLAQQYGLTTQYFADTHPSIGNYFMLTTGQIITNDDTFMGTVDVDNAVRELLASGKTWKSYAESLPSVGYTGGDVYPYVRHHNPFSFFSDVVNSQNQLNNLVPFTEFATDLANNQLPDFSFIVPNMQNDAHDGSLGQADSWLSSNIAPLLASPVFKKDGLLVIVFDESDSSDIQHGGGQVAMLIISPLATRSYQSTTLYQHESTLRLLLEGLGVPNLPGAAQQATDMEEFF